MPSKKISEQDAAGTPLAGTELLTLVQSGINEKVNASEFVMSAEGTVVRVWVGTQTDYDLLTPASDTLYFITGP